MALQIACPNCGPRFYSEFWFGGEVVARAAAPADDAAAIEADYARVWLPVNAAGRQRERWFHHAGCRRWLTATRDTLTNEFHDE